MGYRMPITRNRWRKLFCLSYLVWVVLISAYDVAIRFWDHKLLNEILLFSWVAVVPVMLGLYLLWRNSSPDNQETPAGKESSTHS